LPTEGRLISLFPGSRKEEIYCHAPLLLRAAALLQNRFPDCLFALSYTDSQFVPYLQALAAQTSLGTALHLIESRENDSLMQRSWKAIAKAGTVTLELALRQVPTLVLYNPSLLNYWIASYLLRIRLPFYCIVNILAQNQVFPEIIRRNITPQEIASAA